MNVEEAERLKETDSYAELLKELVNNSKKQLFYSRIAAFIAFAAVVILMICFGAVVPVVIETAERANTILEQASETIVLADTAIESVTDMSESITEMCNNMDDFIIDNAESVQQVMKNFDAIDFEGLNKAIKDLGDVVEPLAKFFGLFK